MRYFDHNATTPLCAAAKEAWLEISERSWQNPSSPYRAAAAAKARLEECRERLGAVLGVDPSRIVFNSGATEGNNFIVRHLKETSTGGSRLALSPIEHPSVLEPANALFAQRLSWLPVTASGRVDLERVDLDQVEAVSLMAANNETGVLQPWTELAEMCAERGIPVHCDASQWVGKLPSIGLARCQFVTGCGHKFGGPKGVGFLIVPNEFGSLGSFLGGFQEGSRRAGTEDLAGIASMVAALEWADTSREAVSELGKESFVASVVERIPAVKRVGAGVETLWNTVMLEMPEFASSRWIARLEKRGIQVSAGSACSTGKAGPSHVLAAMKMDASSMRRCLRVSSGWDTTVEDWQAFAEAVVDVYSELRADTAASGTEVISI